jgi:hypothetical protein
MLTHINDDVSVSVDTKTIYTEEIKNITKRGVLAMHHTSGGYAFGYMKYPLPGGWTISVEI